MLEMEKNKVRLSLNEERLIVDNGLMTIESNLRDGTMSFRWRNGSALTGLFSETAYGRGFVRTSACGSHLVDESSIREVNDGFGHGISWSIKHIEHGVPVLRQRFYCYEGLPYILMELEVESDTEWETGEMTPLAALRNDGTILSTSASIETVKEELRVLFVPFDNDKWVRYGAYPIPCSVESYEVTAVYGAESRSGIVLGSVRHDFWKTAIQVEGTFAGEISRLRVFGGASGLHTRDTLRHGTTRGLVNVSPLIFVGSFDDYRDGMEAYGRANAVLEPMLPWEGGVPFGWNSWSAVMGRLDLDVYVHTSDFIRQELQDDGFHGDDGVVYINFDAFWNKLTSEELSEAVRRVKGNGQKPGIYFSPFAYWGKDPELPIEGYDGQYKYRDILLKDETGTVLPTLDGAYAIDLSHPVALERIRTQLEDFVKWGFDYVKCDFLSHGAMEGCRYNPEIRSGKQAYRLGMAVIRDTLAPEKIGRPFFINLSIAPLFPHGYAHSRRISCDAFGLIGDTEYMLNAVTYGWWINDSLYRFNDPDHTVLYKSENQRESTEQEGRSRLTSSIIAGTSLLLGDDYRQDEAARRARNWMTHPEVMELARLGRTFRPVDGPGGSGASDVFVLDVVAGNEAWVAVFNYGRETNSHKYLEMRRLGITGKGGWTVRDVWSGEEQALAAGTNGFSVLLAPAESKLLRISSKS
jgi:alpha-galactosidase